MTVFNDCFLQASDCMRVNRRDELTLPQSIISMIYRADRHSDPAPNDRNGARWTTYGREDQANLVA